MDYVLFLDDDHARHARFRSCVTAHGRLASRSFLYTFTAAQAVDALRAHDGEIAEAFLDHDLCVEDQWISPGVPSKEPTGMVVVDHIVTMSRPPAAITIHSFNYHAAVEMCARLSRVASISVRHIPFSELLGQLV